MEENLNKQLYIESISNKSHNLQGTNSSPFMKMKKMNLS